MIFNPFWRGTRQQRVTSFTPGPNLAFDQQSKTLAAASTEPFDFGATPGVDSGVGLVARTNVATFALRTITAGTAMVVSDGDGAAGDPTVTHGDTAVTPGSYTNTSLTVDQQGHIVAASNGVVTAASRYTPTLTNVTNLDASGNFSCHYMRVGNEVTVGVKVTADPTAPGLVKLGISLPIASNLGAEEDCVGSAASDGIAGQCAAIRGDAGNNRAEMAWIAVDVTSQSMFGTFTYQII